MTNDERRQRAIRDRAEEILRTTRELAERDPERLGDVDFMILMIRTLGEAARRDDATVTIGPR